MALLVLIILGASLGWISSIMARTEAVGAILRLIGLGVFISLVTGMIVNAGSPLGGLSILGLFAALAVTIVSLLAYHAFVARQVNSQA